MEESLERELGDLGIAKWSKPNGGYFVNLDVMNGCAKRVVSLCKEAGVVLTDAGATFPYGADPNDSNIRVAPTFPPQEDAAAGHAPAVHLRPPGRHGKLLDERQ